ncbi:type III secretion system inner membrane ring subunit SctD [Nitratidesulfovibrio sp. SRB-5]|uniref:type III secretion system inner membrane ring subunit SctD n=1 Tax=Nitratidesulfovibrio sp. SRB-5 TaxID=2872636 RepID=UPI0010257F63|nr:type III secretion system inner membrane ring subunit SctD [Nitratidesulfovibrio sp. SRB-5]MBZ2170595.1 type III secretion system inner membrane ring subunit SctD [Nitratidesulfovibrio sp. SRB-5]RXF76469.1 EscD/YscD/HrpQ family type III secretion system inner membrane ring protein [Desulfovibrio sp. DS-1]
MSASATVLLRIFTGPHVGAEVVLPEGVHVVGTDDSCDIILSDAALAARHAALTVAARGEGPGAAPEVHVAPLDGAVRAGDAEIPAQGAPLAAGTGCWLGDTCLAWNRPGAEWDDVLARPRAGGEGGGPVDGASQPSPPAEDLSGGVAPGDATPGAQPAPTKSQDSPAADAHDVGGLTLPGGTVAAPPPRRGRSVVAGLLALVCAVAIVVTVETRPPAPAERVAAVEEALRGAGVTSLEVASGDGGVVVRGLLDNDGQRAAVWKVARNLLYPVQIDVAVRDDVVHAVQAAFNSRALYPEVEFMDAQSAARQQGEAPAPLKVAGYVRDGLVEAWAFSALRDDVPSLPPVTRDIRYASDVAPVLDGLLGGAGLRHVQVRYLPGTVELAGDLDARQRERLDEVLAYARAHLGVPVRFAVVRAAPVVQPVAAQSGGRPQPALSAVSGPAAASDSAMAAAQAGDPLEGLQVRGVTLNPLRFVTIGDGQRIFEGGMLPGGYVLESISTKELHLRKDGRSTTYRLRGSHE